MSVQISRAELDDVKKALDDAEHGRATMGQLARAHDVCARAEAAETLAVVRREIRRMTPAPPARDLLRGIVAGLISGSIIWATLGRRRETHVGRQ